MKNKFVSVFFVVLFLCRVAVAFEANVSRTVIPEGESFQLYLRQNGNGAKPDLSVLNEDFLITMERKSFKSSYVNGKTETFNENVLTLIPKKTGKVILPSIRAGKEKTKPVTLTVVAGGQTLPDDPVARKQAQNVQPNVFIRYALKNEKPYVGQQIPLTVKLYAFVQTPLLDGTVIPPKADGVTAEQWGDAQRRREVVNNRTYDVLEYQYLLFAQKSGKLELSPAQFRGTVSDPNGRVEEMDDLFGMGGAGLFSGFFSQKSVAVQSSPVVLDVKPIPTEAGGGWLPATDVAVSEDLTPPKQTISLGEALTRTVTVMASGARDTQIPDPVFVDGSDYKQYPGKTDSKNLFDNDGIVGVKTRQIVFMPTTAGSVVLPSMEIPWFNVKTGKMKKAVLPSRTILVTSDAANEQASAKPALPVRIEDAESVEKQSAKKESVFAEAFSEPVENTAEQKAARAFWEKYAAQPSMRLFLAGIIAGGAVVGILWLIAHFMIFRTRSKTQEKEVKQNGNVDTRRLKEACLSGSAEKAHRALLEWGQAFWPENPPLTASELAKRMRGPALIGEVDILNGALYGENKTEWNGEDFWLAFKAALADEKKKPEEEKIPVPPLYPD